MATFRTHYDNLKVARDAPNSVIKAAYKVLMQQYHPDKFNGTEQEALRIAKLIKHSYDVLIDPVKRAEHDRWINDQEAKAKQQSEQAQFEEAGKATEHQYQRQDTPKSSPPKNSTPVQSQPIFKKVLSIIAYTAIIIATLIVMSIGGMFGRLAGRSAFTSATPSAEQYEAKLMSGFIDAAQKINKQGATIVNDETLMDGATVGPGLRITYHYILRNYTSQNVDPSTVQTNIRTEVTHNMCSKKEMKLGLQYGAIYGYIYAGNDNVEITRFEIDRNDCEFETLKTQQTTPASTKNNSDIYSIPQNTISKKHNIQIYNQCREPISVSITYWNDDMWITQGWWLVQPLSRINTGLQTNLKDIYTYAYSTSYIWKAKTGSGFERPITNQSYIYSSVNPLTASDTKMVPFLAMRDSFNSSDSYYEFSLTCPSESDAHFAAIEAVHPDLKQIDRDPRFDEWIASKPQQLRLQYNRIRRKGTSSEVINMLNAYKSNIRNPPKIPRSQLIPSNNKAYLPPSIPGDTNNDGILSGSEQYIRDNSPR